jgi:glutaredoxin 3
MAERLLRARGIPFEEVDVTGNRGTRDWLVQATRQRTVPQIFIGKQPIGGFTELAELDRRGELLPMVSAATAAAGSAASK